MVATLPPEPGRLEATDRTLFRTNRTALNRRVRQRRHIRRTPARHPHEATQIARLPALVCVLSTPFYSHPRFRSSALERCGFVNPLTASCGGVTHPVLRPAIYPSQRYTSLLAIIVRNPWCNPAVHGVHSLTDAFAPKQWRCRFLFVWQIPTSWPFAILYRDDYAPRRFQNASRHRYRK